MALDDSQIARQNFEAAKNFVKRGSLTADEKAILESFPPEVFSQTDPSVEKQTDKIKGWWLYQGKKEGEFNLLFYAINARNKDAVSIILPKSGVDWQNSSGSFIFLQTSVCYGNKHYWAVCEDVFVQGYSALHLAVRDKSYDFVDALLQHGNIIRSQKVLKDS